MNHYFNKGNDCESCRFEYLTGIDGDVIACRRRDMGRTCSYEAVKTCGDCAYNDCGLCDVSRLSDGEDNDKPIPVNDDREACGAWVSKY